MTETKIKAVPKKLNKPFSPKDKLFLLCSPLGGYSLLPESHWVISYMNPDASINWKKLENLLKSIANIGAGAFRDFAYWITNQQEFDILSPFKIENRQMIFNQQYFKNQREIASYANELGLTYIYDLYNGSEARVAPAKHFSPWLQVSKSYFYEADSFSCRKQWEKKILETFKELDVWYQTCNEPSWDFPQFVADTYNHLIQQEVPPDRVLIGVDYGQKKVVGGIHLQSYNTFKKAVIDELGKDYEVIIKRNSWSPVHKISDTLLDKYFYVPEGNIPAGGQRQVQFSTDGRMKPRPGKDEVYRLVKRILQTKNRKARKGRIGIETVYGKETGFDPLAQLKGAVKAYIEFFGEKPNNSGKYPGFGDGGHPSIIDEKIKSIKSHVAEAGKEFDELIELIRSSQ